MTLSRRDLILSAGGALLASALPAGAAERSLLHGSAFGSSWTLAAAGLLDEAAIRSAFEAVIASVDGAMSLFRTDSELSLFNRRQSSDFQQLSVATLSVVQEALRIAALTSGSFNPTLGPLVGRYGFGPISSGLAGTPEEITVTGNAVRKARSALTLDLNGIAKGYALDQLVAACKSLGINEFLLELGGEVHASGRHPADRAWQVGIERPGADGSVQRVVALDGAALATSGNGINGFAYGGRRYSHIIDPISGRPTDLAPASVTVASGSAMTADALATALFAMGPERGPEFAKSTGIEAFFVLDAGAREVATGGFETRILG